VPEVQEESILASGIERRRERILEREE